ncbi:MAG: DegT/DnrJ/EryC1/StrS family aminotransferase [Candidatus Thiodiazotropha endolucinida]|nr:DegT/DnrJ/EryC1/StrS family aminotransferase [Candidatus Thiodiazotropha taylori]MCW4316705.1 DegT/DnrJ/EryC1/StrS family aminotransferase [Candidatus Thiodiazotropha taylori]
MAVIPFHKVDISEQELEAVTQVIRSGWLTSGPVANEFEQSFAKMVNASHAVALNSCTAALHLALEAVGVRQGDEVIVPTMTFAATAEAVLHVQALPVIVDIDPSDHNISLAAVEQAITPRTRAIIPVDFGGQPADIPGLLELAHSQSIYVIEDAAHAFPAKIQGQSIGSLSDITCFSFYATKTITCSEGGMATTKNREWADRIRRKSLHGISRHPYDRSLGERKWFYDVVEQGWKYNLSDMAAALGLAQLQRVHTMWQRRFEIAVQYTAWLKELDEIELLTIYPSRETSWHLYVIKLISERLTINRDRFIQELEKRGVNSSVHFIPLHLHSYFRSSCHHTIGDMPNALDAFERSISLPIYSSMTDEEINRVGEAVRNICKKHRR